MANASIQEKGMADRREKLSIGDRFPELGADAVDGSHFTLPDDLNGIPAVLVFYRGHF